MTKAIKFNLILDGNPVRNRDDLSNNFNVEDILRAYHNGSLKRWLDTRGMTKESTKLDKISGSDIEIALKLCEIFQAGCTEEQVKQAAYAFELRQKEAEQLEKYNNLKKGKDDIISAYHSNYEDMLNELDEKGNDYSFVKPALKSLHENHSGLYNLDKLLFYNRFIGKRPLIVLAMLANDSFRGIMARTYEEIFKALDFAQLTDPQTPPSDIDVVIANFKADKNLPGAQTVNDASENEYLRKRNISILVLSCNDDRNIEGTRLESGRLASTWYPLTYIPVSHIPQSKSPAPPKNHVKIFAGETETYWKALQPKGTRFMIIKMESGNFVRNAGETGQQLRAEDVNRKFPILDGIDYMSNNEKHQLFYMEV
ncbi:MAG: hypothetical protein FWG66_10160 [Spirochaetes bacterium]|nr:hypothetical protein [Spirochaetota bacterium]